MVGGYSGDAGDSLASSNGKAFVVSQIGFQRSGWWGDDVLNADEQLQSLVQRNESHFANLNGFQYYRTGFYFGSETFGRNIPNGVFWSSWRGLFYSLQFTEMKLRREGTVELRNSASHVFSSLTYLFISLSSCICLFI